MVIVMLCALPALGQDKVWSLQAGFGETTMLENRYDGEYIADEDKGNVVYVAADYWLSQRLALTGGLTFEQQGLFTSQAEGIGLKKVNMLGVHAGAKFYFFPKKWIVQPHIGAAVYTNCLNLDHRVGESSVVTEQGYANSRGVLSYDVRCPALSLAPRLGVDIHLLSSISLCVEYDYRFGLWGSNKGQLKFSDGPIAGHSLGIDERNNRSCISLGLKIDFPTKSVSDEAMSNLFQFIGSWLESER